MTKMVIASDGSEVWYKDDIDASSDIQWSISEIHRLDGPAYIMTDGRMMWWVGGIQYTSFKAFQKAGKLTDDQMTILILKYGEIK